MTGTPPICMWCDQPITGRPAYWDGRPLHPARSQAVRRALSASTGSRKPHTPA